MKDLAIGEKIRLFRKRAGLTQLELELKIGAASGSISRIEKGETNPLKETLLKIIETLNLQAKDAAFLFDIEIEEEYTKLVNFSKKFNTLDLNQVINNFTNDIVHELNLTQSVLVWIKEGDVIKTTPFTKHWYTELVLRLLPIPFSSIKISMIDPKYSKNVVRKAAEAKKVYQSERLADFGIGILDTNLLDKIQKIIKTKISIAIPIVIEDECIGVVASSWEDKSKSQDDLPVVQALTNQLAIAINNIYRYNDLQEELNKLKNKSSS